MGRNELLVFCSTLLCGMAVVLAQSRIKVSIPKTGFTCTGRAAGYYADVETGCQVYHMCDGLGRQFSYTCPNTTLFQQRMLICDHWYMVNCSMSERDYNANLLIGQRDKPFVSEEEMRQRTPRPDILSIPLNDKYYDGLKEAETKFPIHPGNSIVGIADTLSGADNSDLDSSKNYRPPTSWSTGRLNRPKPTSGFKPNFDHLAGAASQRPNPAFKPTLPGTRPTPRSVSANVPLPSKELSPPFPPSSTERTSQKFDAQVNKDDSVVDFIKRFDPNSPNSHKTSMSRSEIIDLNKHLPAGQVSSEEDRNPRKNKNFENNANKIESDKSFNDKTRFETVNSKPNSLEGSTKSSVPVPDRELLPPKTGNSEEPFVISTTMGPPIYYEWKWAVPAFDLQPPNQSNSTNFTNAVQARSVKSGKSPFSYVTRPTIDPEDATPVPKITEYNISSYFVPDYVFPLDKPHPGYENDDAETSFQVKIARPGRSSYGENPDCPHCHPAYLNPGSCEPCIVKR